MKRLAFATCAAALLAGCDIDMASHVIAGNDLALTVVRTKPYFWSSGWELELVVRNNPTCQRRYRLKDAGGSALKIDLYEASRGVFILRQNKRWYVTELKSCGFEPFKEEPPEPGELLGTFQEKGGVFKFVSLKDDAKPAAKDR